MLDSRLPSPESVAAKAAGENFPVASRLLPRRVRRHLLALYDFARLVDDAGDESPGDRLLLLDRLEDDVARIYRGGVPRDPIVRRMAMTVEMFEIPPYPLYALIEANRRDQRQHTYLTFHDLLDYCSLSANPVGHLVLCLFGAATPERVRLSDAICTGLQLTEHWQDVAEDFARGRIYLPQEDFERFGCTHQDLAQRQTPCRLRTLMAFEVRRARDLLETGRPLIRLLDRRAALAVAGFVAGGRAALDAIARKDFDVLAGTPRIPARARLGIAASAVAQSTMRRRP
jgi:squalene synthase HpnC